MELKRQDDVEVFQSTRPLRGATEITADVVRRCGLFQSTRPLRGATKIIPNLITALTISIHAPLAGRDGKSDEFSPADLRK